MFISKKVGPFKVWIGGGDGEHPSRWAGIWIPRLGEFEMHVTSAVVHLQPEKEADIGCWHECPFTEEAHPDISGHEWEPAPVYATSG